MLEKFRNYYNRHVVVKLITVVAVVLLSMLVMLPLVMLADLFGVNLRENGGLNLKVDLANMIFFFLFVCCSTTIIWIAQKHIHKGKFLDLGFRTKVLKFLLIGFIVGIIKCGAGYAILISNAESVVYNDTIPNDVSILSYIGYYIYFIFGFILLNSFVEELVTRAYPIEKLKRHINPHVIFSVMGIIFTLGHFFTRDFDFGYCLSLFIFSYTFSLVYYYSNSIWIVIGMHSGINWVTFSFFGTNWKLGAIVNIQIYGVQDWIASFAQPFVGLIILVSVVILNRKGFFKKLSA